MHRYFIINKPYNMVSQFVSDVRVRLLGDLDFDFPEGTHAVGRLDSHSEGLLILTTNKKVTRLLFQGVKPHERSYHVRVKGEVTDATLERLRTGVTIPVTATTDHLAIPQRVAIVPAPAVDMEPDDPRIWPERAPHTWLEITLTEGKYHQVRKMTGAVKHRCQRLIRTAIEDLQLGTLGPGQVTELSEETFFRLLKIDEYRD